MKANMGVNPKIGGFPPKWMVKIMENPMNKWDDWGETPLFLETSICSILKIFCHPNILFVSTREIQDSTARNNIAAVSSLIFNDFQLLIYTMLPKD